MEEHGDEPYIEAERRRRQQAVDDWKEDHWEEMEDYSDGDERDTD
jgi:hypothetical protein